MSQRQCSLSSCLLHHPLLYQSILHHTTNSQTWPNLKLASELTSFHRDQRAEFFLYMEMVSDRHPTDSASDPDSSGLVFQRDIASDPLPSWPVKEGLSEDDDDMFMVPQMEDDMSGAPEKRGRSRNTADREHKKIKRLLRNRVSAQQARERKKVYVSDMEQRARELQESNSRLEEKISTLINENTMLRKVLINSRPKNENADSKH